MNPVNKEVSKSEVKSSAPAGKSKPSPQRIKPQVLGSVDLQIEAFLGHASLTVDALRNLEPEDVVELDAPLNQAVELRLNGVVIAAGELVAVGDKFGVKITEISQD